METIESAPRLIFSDENGPRAEAVRSMRRLGRDDARARSLRAQLHHSNCGDGILDGGETCDDGNNKDGDGWSANCRALK